MTASHHTTEIVETTQLNNECISVKIRCCGDSLTDEVVTIYRVHTLTPEQIQQQIDAHHDAVAQKHRGLLAGLAHVESIRTSGAHRKVHNA